MTATFDTSHSSAFIANGYKPLRFTPGYAREDLAAKIAVEVMNQISGNTWSRKRWEKQAQMTIKWEDKKGQVQVIRMRFGDLVRDLVANRSWPSNGPQPRECWIDSSVVIALSFQALGNQAEPPSLVFELPSSNGKEFPLVPKIDREGIAFSSMQGFLQGLVLKVRTSLVERSDTMLALDSDWMHDLLSYLNSSVSVVETTLHQLYYKGKYDKFAMGWRFDEEKVGPPTVGRFLDKIKWVNKITGKALDNVEKELNALKRLKYVRNHLNHFDPPVFACTIEDVAGWLNCTEEIAQLLWKIRTRSSAGLNPSLIRLLLAPRVEYVPHDPGKKRAPQAQDIGYGSCVWPSQVAEVD